MMLIITILHPIDNKKKHAKFFSETGGIKDHY
jgi:hypothetical protein